MKLSQLPGQWRFFLAQMHHRIGHRVGATGEPDLMQRERVEMACGDDVSETYRAKVS